MTIRQHLRWLTALVVATTLGLAGISVVSFQRELGKRSEQDRALEIARLAYAIRLSALQQRRFEKDVFLNLRNAEKRRGYQARFDDSVETLRASAQELSRRVEQRSARRHVERLLELHDQYLTARAAELAVADAEQLTGEQANERFTPRKHLVYELERIAQLVADDAEREQARLGDELTRQGKIALVLLGVLR